MNDAKSVTNWERLPNDLFVSKLQFKGNPQPTKEVFEKIGSEGIEEIDNYFKNRAKKKKLNSPETKVYKKALSEILTNRDRIEVLCFDGIILQEEAYEYPKSITRKDYTIILLSELISSSVKEILISHDMNEIFKKRHQKFESESRKQKFRSFKNHIDFKLF